MRLMSRVLPIIAILVWLGGCAHQIADYSLEAYKNATDLKADTAALIDKSGEPYAQHVADVEEVTLAINKAYEFSAGTANNALSTAQWEILRASDGGLYGSFVRTWKHEERTSAGYRAEKKRQMGRAFDYIICLEANKQADKPCGTAKKRSTVAAASQ